MNASLLALAPLAAAIIACAAVGYSHSVPCVELKAKNGPRIERHAAAEDACNRHAKNLRRAAREAARSKYWRAIAVGSDEGGAQPKVVNGEARADWRAELDRIDRIYRARIELCELLGPEPYDPQLLPAEFSSTVDQLYLPLVVGRTLVYEGRGAKGLEVITIETMDETIVIEGVDCRTVVTTQTVDGELVERTIGWYAQHLSGDVWNLGELAQHYENDHVVDTEGSWLAGAKGAEAGVQMLQTPVIASVQRKALAPDDDEDIITVVGTNETVVTAMGTYTGCVKLEEWSPLESEREFKYFAPGIGLVLEVDVLSGERTELVEVRN